MSLVCNGSDDRIERTSGYINHNSTYTLMAWVRINTDRNNYQQMICIVNGTWQNYQDADWCGTDTDGTTSRLRSFAGGSGGGGTSDNLSVGTWYHFALVRESTTSLKFYLNGVSKITSTTNVGSRAATSREVYGVLYNTEYVADYSITAIKGWSVALTQSEVDAEKGQYDPVITANLVHYVPAYSGTMAEQLVAKNGSNLTNYGSITASTDAPSGVTAPSTGVSSFIYAPLNSRFSHLLVR